MTKQTAKKELKRYNHYRGILMIQDLRIKLNCYLKLETGVEQSNIKDINLIALLPSVTFSKN